MQKRIYIHCPDLPNTVFCLKNIVKKLKESDITNDSVVIFSCSKENHKSIEDLAKDIPNHEIYIYNYGPELWEYPTLSKMWLDSLSSDFYCLYLHVKGASKTEPLELENSIAWQNFMLHGVVENYKTCEDHLDSGADLVGAIYHWHFKGNFWWANSKHIKKLPNPILLATNRYDAEYWICLGLWWGQGLPIPKPKCLFYIPGLTCDEDFSELEKNINIKSIPMDIRVCLADTRIDNTQPYTIREFLQTGYRCALDIVDILEEDVELVPILKNYLSYNGVINIHKDDDTISIIGYEDISRD